MVILEKQSKLFCSHTEATTEIELSLSFYQPPAELQRNRKNTQFWEEGSRY